MNAPTPLLAPEPKRPGFGWCWICRWVWFMKRPLLPICTLCREHPLRGLALRRKPGDDLELDSEDTLARAEGRSC